MSEIIKQRLLNPEIFKMLKLIRAEIRKETGEDIHFSDADSLDHLIELGLNSKNPRVKFIASTFENKKLVPAMSA